MSTPAMTQEILDRFYAKHGACCAGCDWWRHVNSMVGECTRSAPVAGKDRYSMLGIRFIGIVPDAGHVMTHRGHHCGEFKDDFDWSALYPSYLRRIGRTVFTRRVAREAAAEITDAQIRDQDSLFGCLEEEKT